MRSAVLVAGGEPARLDGTDRAVAPVAGTPMVRRVADRVAGIVDDVVIDCRGDQAAAVRQALVGFPHEVTLLTDGTPDEGPLAGLRRGLAAAAAPVAFVVAADMPFVEPALVEYLFGRVGDHDAVVPRLDDGTVRTLQAVYRADPTLAACEWAIDREESRIAGALSELDHAIVDERAVTEHASVESFETVDTPEKLAAADRRLE